MEKILKSIKFPGLEDTYIVAGKVEVDTELSGTSENPVQNKVIKEVIDDLTVQIADAGSIDIDLADANEGEITPVNADTLGGVRAEEYIKKSDAMVVTKNYSVVGGPNQPENPTENMIWVQTETEEIGKVYFSGVEPKNCVDNDIWISTSKYSSTAAFDSIKIGNDTMQTIYPISAKQYVNGAWVDVAAKSYQGGEWVDWSMYIFKDGVLDVITGFKSVNGTAAISDTIDFITNTNAYAHWYSNELVDVTNLREIRVTVPDTVNSKSYKSGNTPMVGVSKGVPTNSSGSISGLAAYTTLPTSSTNSTITPGVYPVDVSDVDGLVYLVFSCTGTTNWKGELHIVEIECVQ